MVLGAVQNRIPGYGPNSQIVMLFCQTIILIMLLAFRVLVTVRVTVMGHAHDQRSYLKVPKREIFDRSDFPDFYTIKSLREGDLGVKI